MSTAVFSSGASFPIYLQSISVRADEVPRHLVGTTPRIKAKGDPVLKENTWASRWQLNKLSSGRVADENFPHYARDQYQAITMERNAEHRDPIGMKFLSEDKLRTLAFPWLEAEDTE